LIHIYYDGCPALFYNRQTMSLLRVSDSFGVNDIKLTGWNKAWAEPDLIWVTQDKLTEELIESNKPIILEDYRTSPDIYNDIRQELSHVNIRAVVKMMALSDRSEYNSKHYNYSTHQHRIIQADEQLQSEAKLGCCGEPIKTDLLPNIRVMWNWIAWALFKPSRGGPEIAFSAYQFEKTAFDNPRKHDVHFMGNLHFDLGSIPHAGSNYSDACTVLTKHRQHAIEAMDKLTCKKLVTNKRICRLEYLQSMQEAKIVVSPWGWEPVTYRDIEAVLCGCIVVKPDTSFVETWPNIPHIPCRVDFSDLSEVIDQILSNWDSYHDYRVKAYKMIRKIDDRTLAGRFANIVKDYVFKDVI